jgi:hypothetical protein
MFFLERGGLSHLVSAITLARFRTNPQKQALFGCGFALFSWQRLP